MKKLLFCVLPLVSILFLAAATNSAPQSAKIGVVNFKRCVEESKIGKQEQAQFDVQKKQMEQSLEKKQNELKELSPKFTDEYLDSLTQEAEKELKDKFQRLSQELTEQQNQFYQTMDQSNYKAMQKIYEMVGKASTEIAQDKKLDVVLNDEVCFYKAEGFDVSAEIIKKLDEMFDKSGK